MKKIMIAVVSVLLFTGCIQTDNTEFQEDKFLEDVEKYNLGFSNGFTEGYNKRGIEDDSIFREMIEKGQLLLPNQK